MDFSLELLHTMEKDMDTEIVKLMKAVNVSSISEINQKSLEKTLNKGPLATFLSSIVKLFDKNMNLCKQAAVKIDQMKNEQIVLQKQVIQSKNDQLNVVQETVQTEMKRSWADIANKNTNQSKVVTAKVVKEAVKAVNEEEGRSKNLIVYGVKESEEEDLEDAYEDKILDDDVKSIHEATVADSPYPNAVSTYRIPPREEGRK